MQLHTRDVAAMVLAVMTGLAGLTSYWNSEVDLGLRLSESERRVYVDYVAPESIAMRRDFIGGALITRLEPRDGSQIVPTEALPLTDRALEVPTAALEEPMIALVAADAVVEDVHGDFVYFGGRDLTRSDWLARLRASAWLLFIGAGLGLLAAVLLRRGFFGESWREVAIPIGAALAIPLMALPIQYSGSAEGIGAAYVLPALGALPTAHLLASRHPNPRWVRGLFGMSCALAVVVALGTFMALSQYTPDLRVERYLMMGAVALLPGAALALRIGAGADRLDPIAIGITPGAAMTVLPTLYVSLWLLAAWLVVLVAWRRLSIAPLMRIAQRTQRQRDLAVAAAETERARLAADLHDDALQELTALVRRFDVAGDTEGAQMARGVAERLRAICSDLRLPLLDDLGAGPALEWLVDRVEPLAGGPVQFERIDPLRPPPEVELAVFRVAQEALANAVRHGQSPITIRYRTGSDGVTLTVDDAGTGIEPDAADQALAAGHFGLATMQQRAEQIGALLEIRRWPSGGTHVGLEWRAR